MLTLLLRLDLNVIITSHSKTRWQKVGSQFKEAGITYDCYPKLDYLFDLVIELQKRGKDRVGIVRKTRLEEFPDGEVFPFSYTEVAKRYGVDILERKATAEQLASDEEIAELNRLVDLLSIDGATVGKWLAKAGAASFEEMPATLAGKCISFLESKIENKENQK